MYREIEIAAYLQGHHNIISFYEVIISPEKKDVYLVFDFMQSDLEKVIKARLLKEAHIDYILFKILKGLHFMHSKNVIHRDIKPSNILIDQFSEVKIADFGLSRTMNSTKKSDLDNSQVKQNKTHTYFDGGATTDEEVLYLTDYVASRWYRAPEILLGSLEYSFSSDIWSLGCIFGTSSE